MNAPVLDPFAKDRAKTRRLVIAGAVSIVVAIAAVSVFLWWRSPERVMEKNRAFIEQTRARYCKVLENEKKTEPSARVPTPGAADGRELGSYGLELFDDYESINLGKTNGALDHIHLESLEALCAGKSHRSGEESLYSLFGGIVEPNTNIRAHYTKKGLARAIGEKGLAPGRFKAYAAVWRLSDGAFVGRVRSTACRS